jgi:hypothetical protein
MARFLLVLKPRAAIDPAALIQDLDPLMLRLEAEVDHRTRAHLSAMMGGGTTENMPLQLFADVQAKSDGPVLEMALISREAMGRGAPQTRRRFEELVELAREVMPELELVFRSDRDGPVPHGH